MGTNQITLYRWDHWHWHGIQTAIWHECKRFRFQWSQVLINHRLQTYKLYIKSKDSSISTPIRLHFPVNRSLPCHTLSERALRIFENFKCSKISRPLWSASIWRKKFQALEARSNVFSEMIHQFDIWHTLNTASYELWTVGLSRIYDWGTFLNFFFTAFEVCYESVSTK